VCSGPQALVDDQGLGQRRDALRALDRVAVQVEGEASDRVGAEVGERRHRAGGLG